MKKWIYSIIIFFILFHVSEKIDVPTTHQAINHLQKKQEITAIHINEIKNHKDNSNINDAMQSKKIENIVIENNSYDSSIFNGYKILLVDGGNLSGQREPNVAVDVGYGKREYWAFTNDYGQLTKVIANKIILQDETTEDVNSAGRYYDDEAKVDGTEFLDLDKGHIIADSLGGVSNAYNITPQNSILNRYGDQAYMEKNIRDAGGCENFTAIITYPTTNTQIPSHYKYTYTINGNVITDEFDNINPDKANEQLKQRNKTKIIPITSKQYSTVKISELNKKEEYITLKNNSHRDIDLSGWIIVSVRGNQRFYFPEFILSAGKTVTIGDSEKNNVDFHWSQGSGIWNNTKSDPTELYDNNGNLIDSY